MRLARVSLAVPHDAPIGGVRAATHSRFVGACRHHMSRGLGTLPVAPRPWAAVRGVRGPSSPFRLGLVGGGLTSVRRSACWDRWFSVSLIARHKVPALSSCSAPTIIVLMRSVTSCVLRALAPPIREYRAATLGMAAAILCSTAASLGSAGAWWHLQGCPFLEPLAPPRRRDHIPKLWVLIVAAPGNCGRSCPGSLVEAVSPSSLGSWRGRGRMPGSFSCARGGEACESDGVSYVRRRIVVVGGIGGCGPGRVVASAE